MWRAVKGVFGGSGEKEKEEATAVKSREVKRRVTVCGNDEDASSGIVRTEVDVPINRSIASNSHKKLAFILDNVTAMFNLSTLSILSSISTQLQVLTEEECEELIKETEEIGYEPALLNVGQGNQILAPGVSFHLIQSILSSPQHWTGKPDSCIRGES